MSKYCPIVKNKVPYIFCQDCEDKICKTNKSITEKPEQQADIKKKNNNLLSDK